MTQTTSSTVRERSLWVQIAADFAQSRVAMAGLIVLVIVSIAALCAPWITPQNPYDLMQLDVMDARLAPGSPSAEGQYTYVLGTDGQGRDLYSAIVYGLLPRPRRTFLSCLCGSEPVAVRLELAGVFLSCLCGSEPRSGSQKGPPAFLSCLCGSEQWASWVS